MRDRVRAGVMSGASELAPQREDGVLDLRPDLVRAGARAVRARLERRVPAVAIAGHELIDPAARDAMAPGELARTAALEHDRVDHVAAQTHRNTPSPAWVSTIT